MRQRREAAEDGAEMSFLEHLEDLRCTLIRMGLTTIVAMLACFAFAPMLMDVLRHPVEQVWQAHERAHLPGGVDARQWVLAKDLERVRHALPPEARAELERQFAPDTLDMADALPLLRAARLLPERDREAFFRTAGARQAVSDLAQTLCRAGADLSDGQGRVAQQMMGAFQPGEAFMLSLQLAFFAGVILAGPLLLYYMLRFIMPGLLENERRILFKSIWWGMGLFLVGGAFAYTTVLPRVLAFFFEYSWGMGIANDWRIGYYITFAAKIIFAFGLIFELPVVVVPLIKLGLLSYTRMKRLRPYALVGSFALALILAPAPDPGTMLIMALPLYFLYELCVFFARWEQARAERRAYGDA